MILAYPDLMSVLEIKPGTLTTLVIENQKLFRELLEDLALQCEGADGEAVLSEGLNLLPLSKHAEVIDSFSAFSVNRKGLPGKIVSALEKAALNEDFYLKTKSLLTQVENLVYELTQLYTADIGFGKLNIGPILKSIGISVREDGESTLERMLDYMELVREFDREKLYILVNLRAYYTDEELAPFLSTVLAQEYPVLLVDAHAGPRLPNENRLTVDADLCEF